MDKIKIRPHLVLACIVVLWINSGVFSYISVFLPDSIKMIFFLIWFTLACVKRKNYFTYYIRSSKYLIIFFLVLVLSFYLGEITDLSYYIKSTVFLIIIYSILLYYYNTNSYYEIKFIIKTLIIDYIYVGINTILKLQKNPGLSRTLSMSEENIIKILGAGSDSFLAVGNYTFAYSIVIVGLFCAYKYFYLKSSKFIIPYLASLFLIIRMQFTLSLLLFLIFTVVIIFKMYNKSSRFILINMCGIMIFISLLFNLIPKFLISLSVLMPYRIAIKFNQLASFLLRQNIDGTDLNERLGLYMESIHSFLNNIFIGALSGHGNIGGHSTILDFLGQFGLISLPIFIFYINVYRYISKSQSEKNLVFVSVSFLYILCLGLINTIYSPRLLLTLFIFVPFVATAYGDKVNERLL